MTESSNLTNAIRASGPRLASFWVNVATHSTLPIPCEWHKSGSAPLDNRISTACRYHQKHMKNKSNVRKNSQINVKCLAFVNRQTGQDWHTSISVTANFSLKARLHQLQMLLVSNIMLRKYENVFLKMLCTRQKIKRQRKCELPKSFFSTKDNLNWNDNYHGTFCNKINTKGR